MSTDWTGKWVNTAHGHRNVFIIGEYAGHWLVDLDTGFAMLPLSTEFMLIERDQYTNRYPDVDMLKLALEDNHPYGREAQCVHLLLWKAIDRKSKAHQSIVTWLQILGREAIDLLPDTKRRHQPFYLQEAVRGAKNLLAAVEELKLADEEYAWWNNRWQLVDKHPVLPNYDELVRSVCVQR